MGSGKGKGMGGQKRIGRIRFAQICSGSIFSGSKRRFETVDPASTETAPFTAR